MKRFRTVEQLVQFCPPKYYMFDMIIANSCLQWTQLSSQCLLAGLAWGVLCCVERAWTMNSKTWCDYSDKILAILATSCIFTGLACKYRVSFIVSQICLGSTSNNWQDIYFSVITLVIYSILPPSCHYQNKQSSQVRFISLCYIW